MKPVILHILLLLAVVQACEKASPLDSSPESGTEEAGEDTGTVSISLGNPFASTKVADPSADAEKQCSRWAFWLFDQDGEGVTYGTGSAGEGIQKTVLTGTYTAVAVVNYPDALVPDSILELDDISQWVTQLADNTPTSFLMYGEAPVSLEKDQTVSISVDVRRLVSKIGVKKVSVAFENPYLAAKTTTLQSIYLTNLYRTSRMGSDYAASDLSSAQDAWYNAMGWHISGDTDANTDALVGELDIQAVLTTSAPHTIPHYFYAYPNATEEASDTHDAVWCRRSTRLVLQVAVGSKTYYYQVRIPPMGRNKVYVAEEIVLKKLGSMDPELEIPGAVDVVFSEYGEDWDKDVSVSENS